MATGASGGVSAQTGESAAAQDAGPDGVPPYVEFESIDKSYDGRTLVVRDLDLSVREGEFLTLLGPSGSGKTTCLMMLAGFEDPVVRHHPHRRAVRARSAAAAAQHRRGLPELRAVPAPDGGRESVLSAGGAPARPRAAPGARAAGAAAGAARGIRGPAARPALRRPAATRRHRPRAGVRAEPGADGRAARRPGPQPARGDAVRDPAHPPLARRHRGLRHPRSAGKRW